MKNCLYKRKIVNQVSALSEQPNSIKWQLYFQINKKKDEGGPLGLATSFIGTSPTGPRLRSFVVAFIETILHDIKIGELSL